MEYEISICINFPEEISDALKLEKERFVKAYGSGYKSEPHITLYLDSYTKEGTERLPHDLQKLSMKPFVISLLVPQVWREEDRHRNLYVMEISHKEMLQQLHEKILKIAIPYQSPFLREKTRQRLEKQGIHTDGTRESSKKYQSVDADEVFDPHITLGEIDLDKPQADIVEVQRNLKELEGKEILVSNVAIFFYGKERFEEKAKLISETIVPFS